MKIAILGAGAIGCHITAQFINATSHKIYLLARSNYNIIQSNGISVTEAKNKQTFQVNNITVYNDINNLPACVWYILTTKVSDNKNLVKKLAKIICPTSKIITLQNGFNFEEELFSYIKPAKLYSGTCWIKVTKLSANEIRHDFGNNIKLGCYHNTLEPLVVTHDESQEIINIFAQAQLAVDFVDNIKAAQLTKLALNVPLFILAIRYNKSITEILNTFNLDTERAMLQKEIMDAARQIQAPIDNDLLNNILNNSRNAPTQPLTARNEFAKRMMQELPQNAGALLAYMAKRNIQLPLVEKIYQLIIN